MTATIDALDRELREIAALLREASTRHPQPRLSTSLEQMANDIDAKRADVQERVLTRLSISHGTRGRGLDMPGLNSAVVYRTLDELHTKGLAAQRGGWWRATGKGMADAV